MRSIVYSTPGKIHFLGEHAVVYGKPALLTTIDRRCTVELAPLKCNIIEVVVGDLSKIIKTSIKQVIKNTEDARERWEKYIREGNVSILKSITQDEIDYSLITIGETLLHYRKQPKTGFRLTVSSSIPIGSGLGSSAALALTIASCVGAFLGEPFDKTAINNIAFLAEQKKHGLPSGGDNSTCCFGGLVWYRRESPELKIIEVVPFKISKKIARNFLLVDSGKPAESTGEMISIVKNLYQENPALVEEFLNSQETLTRKLLTVFKNSEEKELIQILKAGESNLERIGVVSEFSKRIIREIEKTGGAAKICGGGGKSRGTGTILAYHPNKEKVKGVIKSFNLPYYNVELGVEGLRKEIVKKT